MAKPLTLAQIPEDQYPDYRYDVIFNAYKWDPQVEDHNTIARHVVLMEPDAALELAALAEALSAETMAMEEAFLADLSLAKPLALPKKLVKALPRLAGYEREQHVRLMRFDFHPTPTGWAISEVNSDVPGGFAEASALPGLAAGYFPGYRPGAHFGECLLNAFRPHLQSGLPLAFVHATSYSDDRQVMQFLSDYCNAQGVPTLFAGPDHLRFEKGRAVSILEGNEGEVGGIVRFFPLEWLANLPRQSPWQAYFSSVTPACNHPVAIFAQAKRLPLVWDRLGVDIPTWKQLLPETRDPREYKALGEGWILKPNLGRVGEGISIPEAIPGKEYRLIQKAARRYPKAWLAQRRFTSAPLHAADGGEYHLCVGVFTVNARFAGFYARVSPTPRIDSKAEDIPVLVKEEGTA